MGVMFVRLQVVHYEQPLEIPHGLMSALYQGGHEPRMVKL